MNKKITFPELASFLTEKSGLERKVCEQYIKTLFATISATLVEGESVKVKGLGTFKLNTVEPRRSVNINTGEEFRIPEHRRVIFVPAKDLAERVNAPFSAFETVELNDSVTDDDLARAESTILNDDLAETQAPQLESVPETVPEVDSATEEPELVIPESPVETIPVDDSEIDGGESFTHLQSEVENNENEEDDTVLTSSTYPSEVPTEPVLKDMAISEKTEKEEIEPTDAYDEPIVLKPHNARFGWGFLTGVGTAAVICILGFALYLCYSSGKNPTDLLSNNETPVLAGDTLTDLTVSETKVPDTVAVATTDTVSQSLEISNDQKQTDILETQKKDEKPDLAPTKPSDKKVYDTITKTRYLTTMAKEHYGNYHLWPYIYEENKSFLGHPDRIRPGTKIVVPPLSKYGVDPNNPNDIAKAKRKGVAIYSRFR